MPKPREELRRGLRALIERTSREMEALGDPSSGDVEPEESVGAAAPRGAAPDAIAPERSGAPGGTETGTGKSSSADATSAIPPTPAPSSTPPSAPVSTPDPGSRPMLRLVRNTVRTLIGTREAPSQETLAAAPATAPSPQRETVREPGDAVRRTEVVEVEGVHLVHPRRGVCESYYINHACWEVPDAFCNHALHTCMLRDCPVYNLHREDLEKRFAARYSHLW